MSAPQKKASPLALALAWVVVTIPLGWGVFQSVVKSLPVFHMAPASEAPPGK
jgi:hypothetical protein